MPAGLRMTERDRNVPDWATGCQTLNESDFGSEMPAQLWLVHIGSPEDAFNHAGRAVALDGVRRIEFGRGASSVLEIDRTGDVVHVRIPLGWVSTRHAELVLSDHSGSTHRIRDLGSRNGVIVEQLQLEGDAPIGVGQAFEIGRSFWMLQRARPAVDLSRDHAELTGVGTSNPEMWTLLHALDRLATANLPILLTGETGVGKGQLARAVHARAGRPGPFVQLNLSGPRAMEHFRARASGDLRRATAHGTLLLDDVGELDSVGQTELLASIIREFGDEKRPSTRIVSTTHRDLRSMVAAQTFRPDLYARLAGFEADIPPLRERREDLGRLALALLPEDDPPPRLSSAGFRRLLGHRWPFNVRQLRQTLEAAYALSSDPTTITLDAIHKVVGADSDPAYTPERIGEVRQQLLHTLREHGHEFGAVARIFDCTPEVLERWVQRFEIPLDEFS
jgi:DNA-binding NtrC family response regulator